MSATLRDIALPAPARSRADRGASRRDRLRPQTLLLVLLALAPYDGLLLLAPLPGGVGAWKQALVVAAVWLALLRRSSWPERRALPAWAAYALALTAWGLLSVALHPSWQSVVGFRINFVYLLVPLVLWWCPFDAGDRDRLVTGLMVNAGITSAVGVAQQFVGAERLNALGYEYNSVIRTSGGFLRSFSTFAQPFPFAFYVMVALLVALPVALEDRGRLRNRLFLLSLPLLLAGMGSAIVRGALLGAAAGLVYLGVTRYRVLAHALVPLPVVAVLLVSSGVGAAMLSSASLDERTTGWIGALADEPLRPLGDGIGTTGATAELFAPTEFGRVSDAVRTAAGANAVRYQADNQYVKLLVELGPIGLWLFGGVVVTATIAAHRAARRSVRLAHVDGDAGLAAGIAAATIAAAVAGVVATYWEIFPVDLAFWTLLGVLPSLRDRSS